MPTVTLTPEHLGEIRNALTEAAVELHRELRDSIDDGREVFATYLAVLIVRNERAQYHAWGLAWPCYPEPEMQQAKTPGQLAYEEDVRRHPKHDDGSDRPTWDQLETMYTPNTAYQMRQTWERNPTPREYRPATLQAHTDETAKAKEKELADQLRATIYGSSRNTSHTALMNLRSDRLSRI